MRITRRQMMTGGAAIAASALKPETSLARLVRPQPFEIRATPIPSFSPREPVRVQFGAMRFRGGLVLSARHDDFGGWSGLWRAPDGKGIVAISDAASWLTADMVTANGRLSGLANAVLAPVLGSDGRALWRTRSHDCEGLCILGGIAHVCIERTHEVMRFDWGREGVAAKGRTLPVPREVKALPSNKGLEAIGVIPSGPLAGALIAISERSGGMDEPTLGVILGGPRPGLLQVRRSKGFDITDLAFLPGGDMVVLERWYAPLRGVGMRIRRIALRDITPGAMLDGETLVEADLGEEIDNMEGLAVHVENGRTILTLISDDNFSLIQRTVLLEFELV